MNNTRINKNLIISCLILLALLAVVLIAFSNEFNMAAQESADAAILLSSFESKDGYLYDSSNNIITSGSTVYSAENYTVDENGVCHVKSGRYSSVYTGISATEITTAAGLKDFINNSTSASVGVLMANIDYNMVSLGVVASGKIFQGVLDGNAYKVTITPQPGGSYIDDNFVGYGELFGESRNYYYTGMLMASNEGTIKNLNIDFVKNPTKAMNVNAGLTSSNTTLINRSSYTSGNDVPTVAGILCGINKSGSITNCNLIITGGFAVGQAARYNGVFDSRTQVCYNSCIVGGLCGALSDGTIERCTVTNNGGVLALADGSRDGVGNKTAASAAGGIVGTIKNSATARIVNCSLAGSGPVNAICGHDVSNRNNDGCWGYAGGAVAGNISFQNTSITVNELANGQISGLISAWTGTRTNIWKEGGNTDLKTIAGCLFDVVINSKSIEKVVILYDYIGYLQANGSNYRTLDSNQVLTYGSWAEIYPENADGTLSVSYDYSKSGSNIIRVEAIAKEYTPSTEFTNATSNEYDQLPSNYKGYFIWSLEKYVDTWRGDDGAIPANDIKPNNNYGAYLSYISSATSGAYVFIFGEKATLTYTNNNTADKTSNYISPNSKYYDGTQMKLPTITVTRKGGDPVTVSDSAYDMSVIYTILPDTENVTHYGLSDLTKHLDMPGEYAVKASKEVDSTTYQYYDDESYVLVDYNENNIYDYVIENGKSSLFNISVGSNSLNWLQSDAITFNYAGASNTIDGYTYSRGNDAACAIIDIPEGQLNSVIPVTQSGKLYYTVNAYVKNPYYTINPEAEGYNIDLHYLKVATTSIQPFVDIEKPSITNVQYWTYSETALDHKGMQLTALELNEWQYDDVIVSYEVRDNNLSGIESGSGHTSKPTIVNDSTWKCITRLTGSVSTKTVYYQDAAGNEATETFSAMIDTTPTELTKVKALNSGEYLSYFAQLGYCPETVKITFTPIFGASGAYLQYAYQKDSNGNDIWVTYDETLKSNQPNTFIIDFEINNGNFKMRLVSKENLYPDSYANETGFVTNGANNYEDSILWNIKIIIAGVGITLDNLYYEDTALSEYSQSELNNLFAKNYDSTLDAVVNIKAKIYSSDTTPIAGTKIIYSELYQYQAQQNLVKVEADYLDVVISYAQANAGSNIAVNMHVDSVGDYYNKYLVRFLTDLDTNNLDDLVTDDEHFLIEKQIATATINKAEIKVYMTNYVFDMPSTVSITEFEDGVTYYLYNGTSFVQNTGAFDSTKTYYVYGSTEFTKQLSENYIYGDTIPSQITIIGRGGEDILLNLITDAKIKVDESGKLVYPPASQEGYSTDLEFADPTMMENYTLSVVNTINIKIAKKNIIVTPKLDGNESFNTTIVFDGKYHAITGTFRNIYNELDNAIIKYYKDAACTDLVDLGENPGVDAIATYYAQMTIENDNYIVGNTKNPIEFKIDKGFLELDLQEQTYAYSGAKQAFAIVTVGDIDKKYYDSNNDAFDIKYYRMENGIASSTPVEPAAVGKYLVLISYNGSTYFYASETYGNAYLTITKASTKAKVNAEEKDLVVAYDANEHEFTVELARFNVYFNESTNIVIVNNGELIYTKYENADKTDLTGDAAKAVVELRSYNAQTSNYHIVDEDNPARYTKAGTYRFRIYFKGDDCFESSYCEVEYEIEPAVFENISFESYETNYVDSSEANYHSIVVRGDGLETYLNMGATIKYIYLGVNYVDNGVLHNNIASNSTCYYDLDGFYTLDEYGEKQLLDGNPFKFNNVGTYMVSATISLDNYSVKILTANIEIKKAKMPKVTAIEVVADYDGNFHPAKFVIENKNNVEYVEYYQKGYEDIQWIQYINYGGIRINVRYEDDAAPIDAGVYYSFITLSSDSYATETVETKVTINQYEIHDDCFANLIKIGKITSNTDLSSLYGSFTDVDGDTDYAKYVYYKANADDTKGEEVKLNSDGTLDPGDYIVEVSFDDGNYSYATTMSFTVVAGSSKGGNGSGNNNESGSDNGGFMDKIKPYITYIAIGGGVLIAGIIAVIVIAVVKGKKKKKRHSKKGGSPRRNGPPPKRNPENINRKRPEEPVKKKTKASIEDKAKF